MNREYPATDEGMAAIARDQVLRIISRMRGNPTPSDLAKLMKELVYLEKMGPKRDVFLLEETVALVRRVLEMSWSVVKGE